jgi:hypothetical protein
MTKSEIILKKVDAIEKLYKESVAITPESLEINKGSLQDISRRLDERLMDICGGPLCDQCYIIHQ